MFPGEKDHSEGINPHWIKIKKKREPLRKN